MSADHFPYSLVVARIDLSVLVSNFSLILLYRVFPAHLGLLSLRIKAMNDLVSREDNSDGNLIDIIIEYLHFEGFVSSAEALKEEKSSHLNERKKSRNAQVVTIIIPFVVK